MGELDMHMYGWDDDHLAHVGRARGELAAMAGRGGVELVVRADPEAGRGVDVAGVGVDAGEVAGEAVVRQDGLDEEGVGVAQDPQLAPERVRRLDGHLDVRGQRRRSEGRLDVLHRLALRVQLAHHRVLCVCFSGGQIRSR
jgi:hypothetical protein